jgi:hypothetical protein
MRLRQLSEAVAIDRGRWCDGDPNPGHGADRRRAQTTFEDGTLAEYRARAQLGE